MTKFNFKSKKILIIVFLVIAGFLGVSFFLIKKKILNTKHLKQKKET